MDWNLVSDVGSGILIGVLLTYLFVRIGLLRRLEKSLTESTLREAVATTRLEAQLKDF